MAALWGLTVLLLFAPFIGLAEFCYDLDPSEIKQTVSTGLPATIEPTFPSECRSLSVDYTCSENGKVNDSKKLSELEPFTDYNCTGLIKDNNVPLDKRTTPIHVRIDCRFRITITKRETTNTSIELTWTTTSDNCQDDLPRLQNLSLSYDCSCRTNESKISGNLIPRPDGGKCNFTGLLPYTEHTCDIVPTYKKDNKDDQRLRVPLKTDVGTPEDIGYLYWTHLENTVCKVRCEYRGRSFGPETIFRARINVYDYRPSLNFSNDRTSLDVNDDRTSLNDEKRESNKCDFEFRDLSYGTEYEVEVTVFNGVLESNPRTDYIFTGFNYKAAIINFLCLPIANILVVVFMVIYENYMKKRRESRSGVNDDMMLESTAIYMNTRPPGRRHKAAR
ncbi:uncharacterized protein LOC110945597 [Acanthochromis polyacanthus]|uniref:uncharacterized protein LOC110945597 n=1 Tax=Acanthochromis polyacanthus TaxID=80966 RepID=UPI002233EDA4|nr:uncharacterized protein LOC110945597 [Acanthochromis polyacanthus]